MGRQNKFEIHLQSDLGAALGSGHPMVWSLWCCWNSQPHRENTHCFLFTTRWEREWDHLIMVPESFHLPRWPEVREYVTNICATGLRYPHKEPAPSSRIRCQPSRLPKLLPNCPVLDRACSSRILISMAKYHFSSDQLPLCEMFPYCTKWCLWERELPEVSIAGHQHPEVSSQLCWSGNLIPSVSQR